MISLEDCIALCGRNKYEVAAISEHEHIPDIAVDRPPIMTQSRLSQVSQFADAFDENTRRHDSTPMAFHRIQEFLRLFGRLKMQMTGAQIRRRFTTTASELELGAQ